jgi:uncharacterized membrane protein HdeD (DUF308 family)
VADLTQEAGRTLRGTWWMLVLRGLLLLVLGLLLLFAPLSTVAALVWVIGLFAIVDGIVAIVHGIVGRRAEGWGGWIAQGVIGLAFGLAIVFWPEETITILFWLFASWLLVLGLVSTVGAFLSRRRGTGEWAVLLTFGLILSLFSVLLMTHPQTSVTIIAVIFGLFTAIAGIVLVVAGFAARSVGRQLTAGAA